MGDVLIPKRKQTVDTFLPVPSITGQDIEAGAITARNIATETITANEIAAGTITATQIEAGSITVTELNFTPFIVGTDDLDDIDDGTTYARVLQTHLSAGKLLLTSQTVANGNWYDEYGVSIDASTGIQIYGGQTGLTTRSTKGGAIQCSVDSNGYITAGGGSLILYSGGMILKGTAGSASMVEFQNSSGTTRGYIFARTSDDVMALLASSVDLYLSAGTTKDIIVRTDDSYSLRPAVNDDTILGDSLYYWKESYINKGIFATRLRIPVGTDMYD